MAEEASITEKENGLSFEVILDKDKVPKEKPPLDPMSASVTSLKDIDEKLKAAEERRKQHEQEILEKLNQHEKRAEEVRANKEKLLASGQVPKGEES
eukprot:maker-scaffold292_size219010-snap-gene-1.44 protein:Tk00325 transcript:maker-scaffold292_size219010-snap-gene-1.44-mRNA-1 annotation:"PREDICTED: stathmin-like"